MKTKERIKQFLIDNRIIRAEMQAEYVKLIEGYLAYADQFQSPSTQKEEEIIEFIKDRFYTKGQCGENGEPLTVEEIMKDFPSPEPVDREAVDDWKYQAKALSAIKKGLEVSLKETLEECERLAALVEYWQAEYYKLNPPRQPAKLDNL